MTLPNFLIIGTAKAGTTSLNNYLDEHPQIYMSPRKELNFFAIEGERQDDYCGNFQGDSDTPNFITNLETYCRFFEKVSNQVAIGEASPLYLLSPKAPDTIKHYIPDVKLIAILRDPVERAYSDFLFNLSRGAEPIADFSQAIEAEPERICQNYWFRWHYKQRGFYYAQLKRYFDRFTSNQIKVYLYEDFQSESLSVLNDIFVFLGVDDKFCPNISQKYNVTSIPKNRTLNKFLDSRNPTSSFLRKFVSPELRKSVKSRLLNFNRRPKPPLLPEVRKQLIEEYREDILKLQELLDKDLTSWLTV